MAAYFTDVTTAFYFTDMFASISQMYTPFLE
jgi:hypothetical protein